MKQKIWLPLIIAISLAAGIYIGSMLFSANRASRGVGKLEQVISLINERYVDEVSLDSLVEMSIPVLLSNLDPHSAYIPSSELESANTNLEGKFSGVGISFQIINDTLRVVEVISNGPAEKAGMLPGDRIIKVNEEDIVARKISNNDVFALLRGEKGTHVNIVVKRPNSRQPITFEVVRDDIPVQSVDAVYMLTPDIGYIRVAHFSRTTFEEFFQALTKLKLEGAENYVVDLRYNGGGYMTPALQMANEFLMPNDVIVSTRGRDPKDIDIIWADGSGAFKDAGVAVLVNDFTASASEIFSGAMQDNDRAWILGRRTFGKGLVQAPIMLPDSSEVRLTVQRYYSPSGRSIQKEYKPGGNNEYEYELINRFSNGETFIADSMKVHTDLHYSTKGGRTVYGGGGIIPDVFVPEDTSMITSYYINVTNQNLITRFAYEYCDLNRDDLQKASDVDQLLKKLPSNEVLLNSFVHYAAQNGVPARWYYINISSPLIVNLIKANICRNILGISAYYEVINKDDKAVLEAIKTVKKPVLDAATN